MGGATLKSIMEVVSTRSVLVVCAVELIALF